MTILIIATFLTLVVVAYATVVGTKHDLSAGGPGPIKATTVTEICVFCHTPHSTTTVYPLWNHALSTVSNYTIYTSPTLIGWGTPPGNPQQPDGGAKLCLSCHDGTVGIGAVLNTPGRGTTYPTQIEMTHSGTGYLDADYKLTTSAPGYIGTFILGGIYHPEHPVSLPVNDALITAKYNQCVSSVNPNWVSGSTGSYMILKQWGTLSKKLRYTGYAPAHGGTNYNLGVQCRSCHDPHNWNTVNGGKFLVEEGSTTLCQSCHCFTDSSCSSCP